MTTVETLKFGFECFKVWAILVGGLVALYEYRRFRRYGAKSQLDVDFDVLPCPNSNGTYLLDIRPSIKNVGSVRQRFPVIEIWVNTLEESDVSSARQTSGPLRFSRELVPARNIVHTPSDPYFVDPGVVQLFPYQVVIHQPWEYVQVAVRFFYRASWRSRLWFRILCAFGLSKRWGEEKWVRRMRDFKVNDYHITSKVKRVK
jgi:hypothetical protein